MEQVSEVSSENQFKQPFSQRPNISSFLHTNKDKIIDKWVSRVCENVDSANNLPKLIIKNSIPRLISIIANSFEEELEGDKEIVGAIHGKQRALTTDYTLPDVLKEYSILRSVIYEELANKFKFSTSDAQQIGAAVDEAMYQSALEFAEDNKKHEVENLSIENKQLSNQNENLSTVACTTAHDLKSPLATISIFLKMMTDEKKKMSTLDQDEMMKSMASSATRLCKRIDNILELAFDLEDDSDIVDGNVGTIIKGVLGDISEEIKLTNAEIDVGEMPSLRCNPELIGIVFQNLIINAIKYRNEDLPKIEITSRESEKGWIFEVSDNGRGIEKEQLGKLFKFSERGENTKANEPGMGIGLATCKRIIEQRHGGKMWAKPREGVKGSTFLFEIPKSTTQPLDN